MSRVNKEDWKPQGVDDLEDNAWEALRENERSILVTAGAGAGKTEFLAQKATYLLQTGICPTPKRILAISFKKDAARNLVERVAKRCPAEQARRFNSMTFDAFTKGLWDRFRSALPAPYNSPRAYKIVMPGRRDYDEFLNRHGFHTVNSQSFEKKVSLADLPIDLSNGSDMQRALALYWEQQFSGGAEILVSFSMLNRLVKLLLQSNPYICKALQMTYPVVFLDEFQDTTYAQYDLLKTAFADRLAVFTAVGDDKQRIMGWAGAMPDAFTLFET
ncbi:UvrD-helicase domain-containing protein, partial [Bilophila wadsworthia]|uniref:UvrD-helicase domain-containing protein n=1 Tax=Bilophila wadsworthia TaxID=35833 RepID=UPI0026DEDECD